ncbi:hypothetical protein [Hymenobacter latericus]|uniref:hypothetical protein n=1 Tax=Hymenobacter sp. YIM 151858-1 TaxID=2987688 RepID=UPI002227953B|nr:hypothetical protein [Hymenobacter sp. YIM 151858-1]UYZ59107.1 hypothetical protein OIS50_18870 [Hymenobacter sp. YIM 151858-1]
MNSTVVYLENQRFLRHWWPLLLLPAVIALLPAALQLTGLRHNAEYVSWVGGATALLVAFLLLTLRLETRLDAAGVHYRMAPLHRTWRHRAWSQISRAYVRSYSPLGEYGGWGLRGLGSNRALNIAGFDGLQLELHDGSRLLLGTQRPAKLQQALDALSRTPTPTP